MSKELELWQFIASRLKKGEPVMLLVVAESTGSSPGRQGYKMAVGADGALCGSIGGGVMEVRLVEQAKEKSTSALTEQIHRKNVPEASGMICSGKQTVIFKHLNAVDLPTVQAIDNALKGRDFAHLTISPDQFAIRRIENERQNGYDFEKMSDTDFIYIEKLGPKNDLYIVGGGHCALALSELISKMDFHISIFDDRPELNTIEKNRFADEITIIDGYEKVGELIPTGSNIYVVVMTLGYASDETVIRQLLDKDFKYFGVLGSRAKMKTLLTVLEKDGFAKSKIDPIHTPIGIAINSRTPEEIAVSIAAEIIMVKNRDQ